MNNQDFHLWQGIILSYADSFVFGHYTIEDITQQCWAWALEITENDPDRKYRDKWATNLKHRLCSWKRQHYGRNESGKLVYTKL